MAQEVEVEVVTENEQENLLQACSESDSLISVRQIKRKYGEDVILSDCYCLSNCLFRISSKCNRKCCAAVTLLLLILSFIGIIGCLAVIIIFPTSSDKEVALTPKAIQIPLNTIVEIQLQEHSIDTLRHQQIRASLSNVYGTTGVVGIAIDNQQNVQHKNIPFSKVFNNETALTRYWTSSTNPTGTIQCQNGYIQWKWINNNNPLHCNTNTANCSEHDIDVFDIIYSKNKNCSGLIQIIFYSCGKGNFAYLDIVESLPSPQTPYSLITTNDPNEDSTTAILSNLIAEIFYHKSTLYVNTEGLCDDNESDNNGDLITINIQAIPDDEIRILGGIGLVISLLFFIVEMVILFTCLCYKKEVTAFTVGWYYKK